MVLNEQKIPEEFIKNYDENSSDMNYIFYWK